MQTSFVPEVPHAPRKRRPTQGDGPHYSSSEGQSSSNYPSDWTKWTWDKTRQREVRYRYINPQLEIEKDYRRPETAKLHRPIEGDESDQQSYGTNTIAERSSMLRTISSENKAFSPNISTLSTSSFMSSTKEIASLDSNHLTHSGFYPPIYQHNVLDQHQEPESEDISPHRTFESDQTIACPNEDASKQPEQNSKSDHEVYPESSQNTLRSMQDSSKYQNISTEDNVDYVDKINQIPFTHSASHPERFQSNSRYRAAETHQLHNEQEPQAILNRGHGDEKFQEHASGNAGFRSLTSLPSNTMYQSISSEGGHTSSNLSASRTLFWTERLVRVLSDDEGLRSLYEKSISDGSAECFEFSLKTCIKLFSVNLKNEAISERQKQVAKRVYMFARTTARSLRAQMIQQRNPNESNSKIKGDIANLMELDTSDDEDDLDAMGDDENSLMDDHIQETEAFLLNSEAYNLFKENFRLSIYPEPTKTAIFNSWNHKRSRASSEVIEYEIVWELPQFYKACFPVGQDLGDILTLSGDAIDAQATSCKSYIETNWPIIGPILLDGLNDLFSTSCYSSLKQNKNAQLHLKLLSSNSNDTDNSVDKDEGLRCSVTLKAAYENHVFFLQAISWICAAFRNSKYRGICTSSSKIATKIATNILGEEKKIVSITLQDLEPIMAQEICWHSVFEYGVVATGFPIAKREHGRGLEISFADMALACQSRTFVQYDEGLVLEGLRSFLIPVGNISTDGAIQWHLEDKLQCPPGVCSHLSYIMNHKVSRSWCKELLPKALAQKRAFLGWVPKICYAIGLKSYHNTINISRASSVQIKYISYTLDKVLYELDHSEDIAERNRARRHIRPTFKTGLEKSFSELFTDDIKHYISVYDTNAQTCWVLPKIIVALFVIRELIQRRRYNIWDGEMPVKVESFATSGTNCVDEALMKLVSSMRYKFSDPLSHEPEKKHDLSTKILDVWHTFNTAASSLDNHRDRFKGTEYCLPKYIHGVEFLHLLEMAESMEIKRVNVNQGWCHLTFYTPVTLFCTGIGQPIIPQIARDLCLPCQQVPEKEENFVVPTSCLTDRFLQQNTSFLCGGIEWCADNNKVLNHYKKESLLGCTQDILKATKSESDKIIQQKLTTFKDGCFVFSSFLNNQICTDIPPSDNETLITIHEATISDLDSSTSKTSTESYEPFLSSSYQDDSSLTQDSDQGEYHEAVISLPTVQDDKDDSVETLYGEATSSKNEASTKAAHSKDPASCRWVQDVKIFNQKNTQNFVTGSARFDPGNDGPNFVLAEVIKKVHGKPCGIYQLATQVFDGEIKTILTREVKLLVSRISPESTPRMQTFCQIPKIAGGYTMILNRKFFEELWPEKVPEDSWPERVLEKVSENLMIRSVEKKAVKKSKEEKRKNEQKDEQQKISSKERINEQEAERQAINREEEEKRSRGG